MEKILLFSKRTKQEYEAEIYFKDNLPIIRHTSLEQIYFSLGDTEAPGIETKLLDLNLLPGIAPMYAVSCTLKKDALKIEEIGELTCLEWENSDDIKRNHPLTTCKNIAFDRAFLRFMQFEVKAQDLHVFYSDCEIPYTGAEAVSVMSKNILQNELTEEFLDNGTVYGEEGYEEETSYVNQGEYSEEIYAEEAYTEEIYSEEGYSEAEFQEEYTDFSEEGVVFFEEQAEGMPGSESDGTYEAFDDVFLTGSFSEEGGMENLKEFYEEYSEEVEETAETLDVQTENIAGAEETEEQTEEIPVSSEEVLEAPMPGGMNSGVTTLPWIREATEENILDSSWQLQAPCDYLNAVEKKKFSVYGVKYEQSTGKAKIVTEDGLVYYDRKEQKFAAEQVDLEEYDLDALYNEVYDTYHINLSEFTGTQNC